MSNKEIIEIYSFCGIKQAKIEISKFLVIIGPQASGKSIIAKLIYWSRMFLLTIYYEAAAGRSSNDIMLSAENLFYKIFYRNLDREFEIIYRTGNISLTVTFKGKKLNINLSDELSNLIDSFIKYFSKQKLSTDEDLIPSFEISRTYFSKKLKSLSSLPSISSTPIYIPAARSFFSQVSLSFFVQLAENKNLDPVIESFGEYLNYVKNISYEKQVKNSSRSLNFLNTLYSQILNGKWVRQEEIDYIEHFDGRKIPISYASSAQQEIFPLCIILSHNVEKISNPRTLIIEEPEAHLYPKAQKIIIEAIVHAATVSSSRVILTTHSPYVLSTFNNLFLAGQLKNDNEESISKLEYFNHMVFGSIIEPVDLSAYKLVNGEAQCLINKDVNLLDADVIDEVSNELSIEFDSLLNAFN